MIGEIFTELFIPTLSTKWFDGCFNVVGRRRPRALQDFELVKPQNPSVITVMTQCTLQSWNRDSKTNNKKQQQHKDKHNTATAHQRR
jgi:hypothetical protein